jgi:hypothetical protein
MTARKKRGRPPFLWHGPTGKKFVTAVLVTQWERRRRPITTAHAIRIVLSRRREFAHLRKYLDRYLEKQFLDAVEFWSPYRKLYKASKGFSTVSTARITGTQNDLVEQKIKPQLFS